MTATLDAPAAPAPRPRAPAPADVRTATVASTPAATTGVTAGAAPTATPGFAPIVVRRLPPPRPVRLPLRPQPEATLTEPRPLELPGQPRAEVSTVLRLALEILDGRRPPSKLSGRLSPSAARYLAAARTRLNPAGVRRAAAPRGRHGPPGLHTLKLSHPADRVTEASAVWRHRGRFRALAARFEWSDGRWCCTALRLG